MPRRMRSLSSSTRPSTCCCDSGITKPKMVIGKTMIAEKFHRNYLPRTADGGEYEVIPVLRVQMPAEATTRRLYAALGCRTTPQFRDAAANPAETSRYSVAKVWCESGIFRYTYVTLFWNFSPCSSVAPASPPTTSIPARRARKGRALWPSAGVEHRAGRARAAPPRRRYLGARGRPCPALSPHHVVSRPPDPCASPRE